MIQRPGRLESYLGQMIASRGTQGQQGQSSEAELQEVMKKVFGTLMLEVSIQDSDVLRKFQKLGKAAQAGRKDAFDRKGMEKLARGQADVLVVESNGALPSDVYLLLAGWVEGTSRSFYALPFELVWVILDDWSVVARFGRTDSAVRVLFKGQKQSPDPKVRYAGYRVLPRTVEHRPRWTLADLKSRLM
jgi:hypothetical protein